MRIDPDDADPREWGARVSHVHSDEPEREGTALRAVVACAIIAAIALVAGLLARLIWAR